MFKNKTTLALAIMMSTFALTACQPKAEKKSEPVEQEASAVPDTSLSLDGNTEKVPVNLPECSGNSCPEFTVDRLHTNQFVVDDIIDRAILKNLDQMLDLGKLKEEIKAEKEKQQSASEPQTGVSGVQTLAHKTAAQSMAEQIQPYVNAFTGLDKELKSLGASSQIKLSISPKILNSDGPLATVVLNTSSYMGGAHGSSAQTYFNFDLKHQKQVELEQIVAAGKKSELEKLAYDAFKKWVMDNQLADNIADYEQVWKFKLSDNYYLAQQGLILQYSEYEIGPYVVGLPRLELPYSQLQNILKKEYLPESIQADQPTSSVKAS